MGPPSLPTLTQQGDLKGDCNHACFTRSDDQTSEPSTAQGWNQRDGYRINGHACTIIPRAELGMWITDGAWIEGMKRICEVKGYKGITIDEESGKTYLHNNPYIEALRSSVV